MRVLLSYDTHKKPDSTMVAERIATRDLLALGHLVCLVGTSNKNGATWRSRELAAELHIREHNVEVK